MLCFTKIIYRPFNKELKYRLFFSFIGFLCIAVFVAASFKDYAAFGRNNRQVKSIINVVNYHAGIISHTKRVLQANKTFQIIASAHRAPTQDGKLKVFVMILGETARTANFSLQGYQKKTNPLLEKQNIAYFNNVTSCGTATAVSVPCIFSHLSKSNFEVSDAQYMENLIDLIQKSGYDIYWQENDSGCKHVCDRVEKKVDVVFQNNPKYCHGRFCYDGVLLENLDDILTKITKDTVIVLHTMGSHGPTYYQRYPDEFKKFIPTCDTKDIQTCTNEEIINTYDNTILYTDYIISSSIDILKKYPFYKSSLLYISDHGESLGEKNMYLHGMPYAIAPKEQTHVPMLFWMNDLMQKKDNINYQCLKETAKRNLFSHDNIFHSILSVLEINSAVYNKQYDVFNKCKI